MQEIKVPESTKPLNSSISKTEQKYWERVHNPMEKSEETGLAVYKGSPIMLAITSEKAENYMIHAPTNLEQCFPTAGHAQISSHVRQNKIQTNVALLKIIDDFGEIMGGIKPVVQGIVANKIKKEFWYYTLEEIVYVFSQGVEGRYGNQARGALPMLAWLRAYDSGERLEFCEKLADAEKETFAKHEQLLQRLQNREDMKQVKKSVSIEKSRKIAKEIIHAQDQYNEKPIKPATPSVGQSKK